MDDLSSSEKYTSTKPKKDRTKIGFLMFQVVVIALLKSSKQKNFTDSSIKSAWANFVL